MEKIIDAEAASASAIRNISDTALWSAIYRSMETERQDALFNDPFARRLAGPRGQEIADSLPEATSNAWVITIRTYLMDEYITEALEQGADMVINLAAGLDTRPYRMKLPPDLRWIEVDFPGILAYKKDLLEGEKPVCSLQRIALDLSAPDARCRLFQELGQTAKRALIVTEGLLIYLANEEVFSLARDLAATSSFRTWIFDLHLPGLVRVLQQQLGSSLEQAGAALKFKPEAGSETFVAHGWPKVAARSVLDAALATNRLPQKWSQLASPGQRARRIDGFVCSSSRF